MAKKIIRVRKKRRVVRVRKKYKLSEFIVLVKGKKMGRVIAKNEANALKSAQDAWGMKEGVKVIRVRRKR